MTNKKVILRFPKINKVILVHIPNGYFKKIWMPGMNNSPYGEDYFVMVEKLMDVRKAYNKIMTENTIDVLKVFWVICCLNWISGLTCFLHLGKERHPWQCFQVWTRRGYRCRLLLTGIRVRTANCSILLKRLKRFCLPWQNPNPSDYFSLRQGHLCPCHSFYDFFPKFSL